MKKFLVTLDRINTFYFDVSYTFEDVINSDTEDFDYDTHTTDGWNDNGLIPINQLRQALDDLVKENSNISHVEIDYNCDHNEYEISTYSVTAEELDEEEERELTEDEKIQQEIEGLERRIKYLKNKRIELNQDDDLPF